jgi:O-acetyl-ADP-ribose deacetylase (regulator of RNase III)
MEDMSEQQKRGQGLDTSDAPASDPVPVRRNHLLAIAVDHYRYLPRLSNCVRDIKSMIDVLHREYTFDKSDIYTLYDEEATAENIIRTLEELPSKIDEDDNLLILFSGHGEYRETQRAGFWVPVNARPAITRDLISLADVKVFLNPLECHHLVMVIDACYSGSIFERTRSSGPTELLDGKSSRWGLSSGRLQPVLDGKPGTHSPFAHSMIKQLKANWEPLRADQLYSRIVQDLETLGFQEQAPDCGYLDLSGNQRGMYFFNPRPERLRPAESDDRSFRINNTMFRVQYGNIVEIDADAVVSSDDTQLNMAGGVSRAINRAAGPELKAAIQKRVDLPVSVGDVIETAGFDLTANYVFHAITLDWQTKAIAGPEAIAGMSRRCLELADERQLKHIAFPAIGTGAAGIDFESTARAMIDAICLYLLGDTQIRQVTVTIYSRRVAENQDHSELGTDKKEMEAFYAQAIRKSKSWSKLQKYLREIPELLEELDKDEWRTEIENLGEKILC